MNEAVDMDKLRAGIRHHVDYVSEREASAIRCTASAWGQWRYNPEDMTVSLRDGEGSVRIPQSAVARFMEDSQRSGRWSLHGRDYAPTGLAEQGTPHE